MRWLLGILVLPPQPLVMFMFVAGGADGKKSSAITWALATAPVFLCAIFAVYRLIRAEKLLLLDWIVIAVALAPYWVATWVISEPKIISNVPTLMRRRQRLRQKPAPKLDSCN